MLQNEVNALCNERNITFLGNSTVFFFFLATAAFISQWNSINPEALLHEEMFFLAISTVKNQYYEHGYNKLSDITR